MATILDDPMHGVIGGRKASYSSFYVLWDMERGRPLIIDKALERLATMQAAIYDWCRRVEKLKEPHDLIMVRLSYDPRREGWSQRDVSTFMASTRRRLGSDLLDYAWVLEVHQLPKPNFAHCHYHVLLVVRRGVRIPKPDEWGGSWSHGSTRVELAHKPWYLATYVGKKWQKEYARFPKGARQFGVAHRGARRRPEAEVGDGAGTGERGRYRFLGTCATEWYAGLIAERAAQRLAQ